MDQPMAVRQRILCNTQTSGNRQNDTIIGFGFFLAKTGAYVSFARYFRGGECMIWTLSLSLCACVCACANVYTNREPKNCSVLLLFK